MPGGVVVRPPDAVRAAVSRQVPQIEIGRIDQVASMYFTERDYRAEPPASVKATMESVADQAANLFLALGQLSEEARGAFFDASYKRGRPALLEEASFVTQMLMGIGRDAKLAVGDTKAGKPKGARRALIQRLASLLRGHDLPADAKPTGDLCFLVSSILEGYGEQVGDVRAMVRDALAEMPPKSSNIPHT